MFDFDDDVLGDDSDDSCSEKSGNNEN